jgi:hypothetical protein
MTGPPRRKRGGSGKTETAPSHTAADQSHVEQPSKVSQRCFESALAPGELAVVERIRQAARTGAAAPTTDELAELIGCESLSTPVAVLRRLQLRGYFVFESFQKGRRFWIPDGRSTAPVACQSPPWRWRSGQAA